MESVGHQFINQLTIENQKDFGVLFNLLLIEILNEINNLIILLVL
jgi:hypothetical protein